MHVRCFYSQRPKTLTTAHLKNFPVQFSNWNAQLKMFQGNSLDERSSTSVNGLEREKQVYH